MDAPEGFKKELQHWRADKCHSFLRLHSVLMAFGPAEEYSISFMLATCYNSLLA